MSAGSRSTLAAARARLTGVRRPIGAALSILILSVRVSAQGLSTQEPAAKPTVSVSVSFARQAIRENDSVQIQTWLANESDQDLTAVRMEVAAPSFIRWRVNSCDQWAQSQFTGQGDVWTDWGTMSAYSVRSKLFCLRSDSNIVVGDFNLLFTFTYDWQREKAERHGFVAVEKTMKVNLFGSESIAGIPISLAGFIVPGLFFWFLVALFKVPWLPWGAGDVALGDRLIYSVLISMLIVIVGGTFESTDISAGVGLNKLGYLAFAGVISGAAIGGADHVIRLVIRRSRKKREAEADSKSIKQTDDEKVLLEKLLESYPAANRPGAVVSLKDGRIFSGSLARKDSNATAIVGSFQVVLDGVSDEVRNRLETLVRARQWNAALVLARTQGLPVSIREPIHETSNGDDQPQVVAHMTWDNADVKSVACEDGTGEMELITLQ